MWPIAFNGGATPLAGAFPFFPRMRKSQDDALSGPLGAFGDLEVRLVRTKRELRKAQRLRFKVFYEEGGAVPDAKTALTRRDADRFDKFCDHLIVVDTSARSRFGKPKPRVVGAYRMLRGDVAKQKKCGFYSADEYDLAPLLARHPGKRFLELGRSCVLAQYRSKRTIELLWRGLLAYLRHHRIDALIGCASFEGANPLSHAMALSFLSHYAAAEGDWRVRARSDRYAPMQILSKDGVDPRKALAALPPLIKGYMRVGAKFGDGAVIDRKFNTVDVFVVMPVADMDARYLEHFSGAGEPRETRAA